MATERAHGRRIKLKAYAGVDPATGRKEYLYDSVPADAGKRELDRRKKTLDARAHALAESRRARRKDPSATPKPARPKADRTIGDAVEAWWKHHGSKLASAPKIRPLIDGIILPNLGAVKLTLTAGTPPDDEDDRDPDLVYLSERWEQIRLEARKIGDEPLAASTIHRCHGIVGGALRRAGHPINDPGLPSMSELVDSTPLPEELATFMPHLSAARRVLGGYSVTRRVRGTDKTVSYTVPAREAEPNAMDLMTEAFALLVASGPRPVEAAAITRAQVDVAAGKLSLDGRGVVESRDADGREVWVIATGETAKRRRRTITLDVRVMGALKRWLTFQDEMTLLLGERLGPRALVFSLDPAAKLPISPKVFSDSFGRCVDRARAAGVDLPDGFHLYSMRHYGISQLLRAGRAVTAVALRFGTSARMIHERYGHAIPSDDAALAETMAGVWGAEPVVADVIPLVTDHPAADGGGS